MLAIQSKKEPEKCVPNVLPCRVRHNGEVNASKRYWTPTNHEDGSRSSYFRGRKLHGDVLQIPDGYRGVVMEKTERIISQPHSSEEEADVEVNHEEEGDAEVEQCRAMEEVASFDHIVVWGHETKRDEDEDPYIKSMNQWINLAQAIHSYDSATSTASNGQPSEAK